MNRELLINIIVPCRGGAFLCVPPVVIMSSVVCEVLHFWPCFAFVLLFHFVPFVLHNG